ncbi:MAG TPA: translation elongation factor Ts [Anaerolineales bacterium]|nr:translation elongation factor Ts [Anaerolineales bacterium]
MSISAELVMQLRQRTGAGVLDCRKALEEAQGEMERAEQILRERGLAKAASRAGRVAQDGIVDLYSHGDGRLGVMVEVNCETDFVARTAEFRHFAHEIALQVAASAPRWLSSTEVPAEVLEREAELARQQAIGDGKPEKVIDQIVEGRLEKFLDDHCLLRQAYVRDEEKSINEMVQAMILSTGENVTIRRFQRWEVGEAVG